MIDYYFGTLTDARKENWNNGEENPYDVLEDYVEINYDFYYSYCFHDEIWIDWGSKAMRATGKELLEAMNEEEEANLKGITIYENEQYGIVEIEQC